MHKIHVTVGSKVLIIAGDYKNETGTVIKIDKKSGKIVVKGVNLEEFVSWICSKLELSFDD